MTASCIPKTPGYSRISADEDPLKKPLLTLAAALIVQGANADCRFVHEVAQIGLTKPDSVSNKV